MALLNAEHEQASKAKAEADAPAAAAAQDNSDNDADVSVEGETLIGEWLTRKGYGEYKTVIDEIFTTMEEMRDSVEAASDLVDAFEMSGPQAEKLFAALHEGEKLAVEPPESWVDGDNEYANNSDYGSASDTSGGD
eukprot:COSAG05_NODE_10764_length_547_cov_5.760062_1_plen_135_part_10